MARTLGKPVPAGDTDSADLVADLGVERGGLGRSATAAGPQLRKDRHVGRLALHGEVCEPERRACCTDGDAVLAELLHRGVGLERLGPDRPEPGNHRSDERLNTPDVRHRKDHREAVVGRHLERVVHAPRRGRHGVVAVLGALRIGRRPRRVEHPPHVAGTRRDVLRQSPRLDGLASSWRTDRSKQKSTTPLHRNHLRLRIEAAERAVMRP